MVSVSTSAMGRNCCGICGRRAISGRSSCWCADTDALEHRLHVTHDRHDAEDATQATFLTLAGAQVEDGAAIECLGVAPAGGAAARWTRRRRKRRCWRETRTRADAPGQPQAPGQPRWTAARRIEGGAHRGVEPPPGQVPLATDFALFRGLGAGGAFASWDARRGR